MDKRNITIVVLIVVLAALLAGGGVYLWQQSDTNGESTTVVNAEDETEESASQAAQEVVQPVKTDKELLVEAMALRHTKDEADVDVTINENDGDYAQGLVKFTGEIAGAWWIAAQTNGQWTIVADGNGVVMCADIAPYNFPVSMVPECWDETTQTNVVR